MVGGKGLPQEFGKQERGAGGGAYTAGVAANAAAEDMYQKTAEGKTAGDALVSGTLTAGAEVAGAKFSKMKNEVGGKAVKGANEVISKIRRQGRDKVSVKNVMIALKSKPDLSKDLLKGAGFEADREGRIYLASYLVDKLAQDPDVAFDPSEFARSAVLDKVSGIAEDKENSERNRTFLGHTRLMENGGFNIYPNRLAYEV